VSQSDGTGGLSRSASIQRRLRIALADFLQIGITARLTITLLAVGALAIVANVIVGQAVPVVQILRVARGPSPDVRVQADPSTHPDPRKDSQGRADALHKSVARYEHAALTRKAFHSTDAQGQFESAAMELHTAFADYLAQVSSALSDPQRRRWTTSLDDFQHAATTLISTADLRRQLLDESGAHLQTMMARLDASLSGSWRIFGHVIARQSLMELRSRLDALRRAATAPASSDTAHPENSLEISRALAELRDSWDRHRGSLSHAEGAAWTGAMDHDIADLEAVQGQIRAIDDADAGALRAFETAEARVVGFRPTAAAEPATVSTVPTVRAAAEPASVTVSPVPVAASRSNGGALVAWVTGIVLVLLVTISALTILSIVRPVRRLLNATARLAAGDADIRVGRGGIRELDTLAVAFNGMAEQLAAAQKQAGQYQHELELRVAERTAELQHLAWHDSLTGLPNRHQLLSLLNTAIARAAGSDRCVGVLFLDIDNFKNLNDSMGHTFGDQVLVAIAARLATVAAIYGFAARWGGDEFAIVYEDANAAQGAEEAGRGLILAFAEPIDVAGRELIISVSVGASIYPEHGNSPEDLLSAADAALFQAKALGRCQLVVFTPMLVARATQRFDIEQGLRRALERNEFELLFQPEVNLGTLQVDLVEALLRWQMPDGRLSAPDEFLEVAEETGLIVEIGDWVLHAAVAKAAEWHHGSWPEARVAINISARQLLDHRLFERVQSLLRMHKLPPQCVEFELTESVLQTGVKTIECLQRLHASHIAIALDDFGTGYSSLASLEQLPLQRIKLDRGLVSGIDRNGRSAAIARAIIDLCVQLDLAVTAEGIERIDQLYCMLGTRGAYAQGYLLSRPVSAGSILVVNRGITADLKSLLANAAGDPTEVRTQARWAMGA